MSTPTVLHSPIELSRSSHERLVPRSSIAAFPFVAPPNSHDWSKGDERSKTRTPPRKVQKATRARAPAQMRSASGLFWSLLVLAVDDGGGGFFLSGDADASAIMPSARGDCDCLCFGGEVFGRGGGAVPISCGRAVIRPILGA